MPPHLLVTTRSLLGRTNAVSKAEHQATGNNAEQSPKPERSHRRDLMETGFKGLQQALKITKEVSGACPQLQLAVGALLVVLEAYKVSTVG